MVTGWLLLYPKNRVATLSLKRTVCPCSVSALTENSRHIRPGMYSMSCIVTSISCLKSLRIPRTIGPFLVHGVLAPSATVKIASVFVREWKSEIYGDICADAPESNKKPCRL